MSEKFTKIFVSLAPLTAFLGSCCALPLLLISLGMGSTGLAAVLQPYRPYFIIVSFLLLGVSFYFVYGRKRECKEGEACDLQKTRRIKIILWIATVLAFIFLIGPDLLARLIS